MERILVIGSPGAGKSTFSRRLREETGLPLYYLDMLWHRPDRTTVEMEVFDRELGKILEKDRWIIDGNYIRTLEMRLKACDTVFFWIIRWRCAWRVSGHGSESPGRTCRGWNRSLTGSFASGLRIFPGIRDRRSAGFWNSTGREGR